ncbi:hypothetical protein F5X97DRAFT_148310 [Nemania serpens]|nr:hypothetical protein F5X97DRAFT_148310 [Nemania serpens]
MEAPHKGLQFSLGIYIALVDTSFHAAHLNPLLLNRVLLWLVSTNRTSIMLFNLMPSDGVQRESTATHSSPSVSRSSPAPSDGHPLTGEFTFALDRRSPSAQAPPGDILFRGSSSGCVRLRESSQQEGGPSNTFGVGSSGSGISPLFSQLPSQDNSSSNIFGVNSSSTPDAPSFDLPFSNPFTQSFSQSFSPVHPPVERNALFGATSASGHQSRGSRPQSRETSNIFGIAIFNNGGAALFGQSSSRAENRFFPKDLSPGVQFPDNKAFGEVSRNTNTSQGITPENNGSPSIFSQLSQQSSTSRAVSPQSSSAANTPSTHTSGALLFRPGSASRDLSFHSSPSNIFGPQSRTSSPIPSPSWPVSSSTISNRGRVLTPRSDSRSLFSPSATNLNRNASPSPARRSPGVDQPRVLQSVEQQDDAPGTPVVYPSRRGTTSSSASHTMSAHNWIPSVSLSPPDQDQGDRLKDVDSMDRKLAQIRLVTPRRSGSRTSMETERNMGNNARLTPGPGLRRRRSSSVVAEPYNIRDEAPTKDPFNAAPFQSALRDAKMLMGELADVLGSEKSHHEPGPKISRFYTKAQELNGSEFPPKRMVGFVGDSGTGKSSLVNSLLDCRSLARTNSEAACTCVATEYHYRRGDKCDIEVERYSRDEIRKQVKDLLLSYRRFHRRGNDPNNRVVEDLSDEENVGPREKRARLAIDTFKAIFRRRMGDDAFLVADSEEEVLGTMYRWLDEDEFRPVEENITATLGECAGVLSRLTSEEPSADGPAVWPFIKKVKVFVDAHILSKGLILVDLPGFHDVNYARQNIAERYILQCDEIVVVCNTVRAATNLSVERFFDLAQQTNKSNIGIICTRSDDFQHKEERDYYSDVQTATIQDEIDEDRETIRQIEEELNWIDSPDVEGITAEQKDAERSLLLREKWDVEKRLEQHEFDIQKYLMEIRARRIGGQLRAKYGDSTPSHNLHVFFVSNTMYWKNRQESRDRAILRLELSGIPAVRRHFMGMVSESQFAEASTFLRDRVGKLLGDIELWVHSGAESTAAERRTLGLVERQMRSRPSELNTIFRGFEKEFKNNLDLPGRKRVDAWVAAAARECWKWDGLPPASYTACCTRFGQHHQTDRIGAYCWNENIMKAMNATMEPLWSALPRSSETCMKSITSIVSQSIHSAVMLLAELHDPSNSLEDPIEALTSREHLLVAAIENAWDDFDNKLRLLQIAATKYTRESFLGQGMEAAYQAANHEYGRGSHDRRKSHITNAATSPQLFIDILKNSLTEFKALTSILESQVREIVEGHTAIILTTLDNGRGDGAAREADRDPAFKARVEAEVTRVNAAMRGLMTAAGI